MLPTVVRGVLLLAVGVSLGWLATASAQASPPSRWIAVSVATLWAEPAKARALDAPACSVPADPRAWVAGMTASQKLWLVGRLESQALYGTKVYLLGRSGAWSRVAVASQPTPRNRWGYPGWVRSAHLVARAPQAAPRLAVIRRPTAWLWRTPDLRGRQIELSYGTRLRAVAWSSASIEVVGLDGRSLYLRRGAAALHARGRAWPVVSGARLVKEAKRFLGLQYLWAGVSGFGFDCSGFTHAVYAALGTTIPRDGGPQFTQGRKVASRSSLHSGDLVFFRGASGQIHHVGMYVGDGKMIHAPRTGRPVAITSILAEPYRSEFAGGRRYTPKVRGATSQSASAIDWTQAGRWRSGRI
ncbi:MAG TPA: C40 family peptidase [Thermoleophilia bacterium]|nr:C40 family peptidase [Thermoleophilia bacterium]